MPTKAKPMWWRKRMWPAATASSVWMATITEALRSAVPTRTCVPASKALTESDTAAPISTSGTLSISDADQGEAHVVAQTDVAGSYGKFSVDGDDHGSAQVCSADKDMRAGQQGAHRKRYGRAD